MERLIQLKPSDQTKYVRFGKCCGCKRVCAFVAELAYIDQNRIICSYCNNYVYLGIFKHKLNGWYVRKKLIKYGYNKLDIPK